jgi:hypothetical protein
VTRNRKGLRVTLQAELHGIKRKGVDYGNESISQSGKSFLAR